MLRVHALVFVISILGRVQSHGGIYNYTIGEVQYAGHYPWLLEDEQSESIQRRWWPDPIQDIGHPYLSCNRGNPLATKNPSMHAPVEAGSNITVKYTAPKCPPNANRPADPSVDWKNEPIPPMRCSGPEYGWVHGLGPLLAYMAACNGPCEEFDPSNKKAWFKIYESGFSPGIDRWGDWSGERDLATTTGWDQYSFTKNGWSLRVPKNLKPGNYLIRHEIIMIELWPPQHYPECAQLTVTGSGNKLPGDDFLVSFPGAYSYDEPGLAISGDLYSQHGHTVRNYTIPGPILWTGEEN